MWLYACLITVAIRSATAIPVQSQSSAELLSTRESQGKILVEDLTHNAQTLLDSRVPPPPNTRKRSPQSSSTVALLGGLNNVLSSVGKEKPESVVPNVRSEPSTRFRNAIERKVRYGPYRIPRISEKNVEFTMLGVSGMTNVNQWNARKPCEGECIVLGMQADLEYYNGTKIPSTTSGAYLHHVVVMNRGKEVWDATCGKNSEHLFESGNEKTFIPFYLPESGVKAGYHLRSSDKFTINTELMNMENEEKWVWLTLQFDLVEGFSPEWKESKVVWVSVGPDRCTGSDTNPFGTTNLTAKQQPIKQVFEEHSNPWTVPKNGVIIGSNSHLHNGGLNTELFVGGSKICTSNAKYAPGGGHSHARRQMGPMTKVSGEQIVEQVQCAFTKPLPVAKGDSLHIRTHYDFNRHAGSRNAKGELDEVMAIAGVLMVFDPEVNANSIKTQAPGNKKDGASKTSKTQRKPKLTIPFGSI